MKVFSLILMVLFFIGCQNDNPTEPITKEPTLLKVGVDLDNDNYYDIYYHVANDENLYLNFTTAFIDSINLVLFDDGGDKYHITIRLPESR